MSGWLYNTILHCDQEYQFFGNMLLIVRCHMYTGMYKLSPLHQIKYCEMIGFSVYFYFDNVCPETSSFEMRPDDFHGTNEIYHDNNLIYILSV